MPLPQGDAVVEGDLHVTGAVPDRDSVVLGQPPERGRHEYDHGKPEPAGLGNPDLVRKALAHMREHGLRETLDLARGVTAPDAALGYSSAGVVIDTGGVPAFRVGQLVACAGAGSANHAEVVSVPGNLVAAVP